MPDKTVIRNRGEGEIPSASDSPPDLDRIMAAADRHGMQMKPPAEI